MSKKTEFGVAHQHAANFLARLNLLQQREVCSCARGGEQNRGGIDGSEIESVPISVIVALPDQILLVPRRVMIAEDEIEFEMQMRAILGNAFARVRAAAHRRDALPLLNGLANRQSIL